ncbi:unnamed protein product [Brassica oleracea var. botrytis]
MSRRTDIPNTSSTPKSSQGRRNKKTPANMQPVVIRRNTIGGGDTSSVSMEPLVRYSQRTSMGRPN